jgi:hypothetical protein
VAICPWRCALRPELALQEKTMLKALKTVSLKALTLVWLLLCYLTAAHAQLSVGVQYSGVSIGINLPVYPQLVAVPGYPVYYAPSSRLNYFFYDGMYWVYQRDEWYSSAWYNGPWGLQAPEVVPLFILRVPVRYYRQPPSYFAGWSTNAPPRWGEHWGNNWAQQRRGWDNWNHKAPPQRAPLPAFQRQYSGNHYPQAERQREVQNQQYRYQPREAAAQQHYQAQRAQPADRNASPLSAPHSREQPQPRAQGQGRGQERGQNNGRNEGNKRGDKKEGERDR